MSIRGLASIRLREETNHSKTKEKDPDVPGPCPLLLEQGTKCQRLK